MSAKSGTPSGPKRFPIIKMLVMMVSGIWFGYCLGYFLFWDVKLTNTHWILVNSAALWYGFCLLFLSKPFLNEWIEYDTYKRLSKLDKTNPTKVVEK